MRGPRATLSQDDTMRIELRITHRLGLSELADVLLMDTAPYYSAGDGLPDLSAAAAEGQIRRALEARGAMTEGWADRLTDEEQREFTKWAEAQVLKAFPSLAEN